MYAVIRAGGKQYRVSPGDVVRVEKLPEEAKREGRVEFSDVMLVSASEGQITRPNGAQARVVGHVVEEGRADKVLVFHYKRKKQFKRLRGHRQPFTAVRITEIALGDQRFTAPEVPERRVRKPQPEHPLEQPSAAEFGEPGRESQLGQDKGVVQVESQAGRKPGMAKRTAGAKAEATRTAKGGADKKAKASAAEKKLTGPQKAGKQKKDAAKKRQKK